MASILGALILVFSMLGGCGTSDVSLRVLPARALWDTPITVRAEGLDAHAKVVVSTSTRDRSGRTWTSRVPMRADGDGALSTTSLPDPGRPIDALAPTHPRYGDHGEAFEPPAHWTIDVRLRAGDDDLARRSIVRLQPVADHMVRVTRLRPAHDGLYGDLFEPAHPAAGATSAVVQWGGSEGGVSDDVAATLAAHGHPALALAYFGEPGLPADLERVPLEYFARALRRLRAAPHVDPHRLYAWGVSRGSEAALLTATHFAPLLHGVVAAVPSSVANPSLPDGRTAAWTYRGRPVPTSQLGSPYATDVPGANIAIARFPGQVFTVCGGQDQVWPSCSFARRLHQEDRRVGQLTYPEAGHLVGELLPYQPSTQVRVTTPAGRDIVFGGTPEASAQGRAEAWPRALAFLDK